MNSYFVNMNVPVQIFDDIWFCIFKVKITDLYNHRTNRFLFSEKYQKGHAKLILALFKFFASISRFM